MEINKKILWGFVLICAIGMYIFYKVNFVPDYGLRPQDFQLNDIQKIVVTKYPEQKEVTLTDPTIIEPIIKEILKGKEIVISQPKANPSLYYLEVYKKGTEHIEKISIQENANQGVWFGYLSTKYQTDSLLKKINSFLK